MAIQVQGNGGTIGEVGPNTRAQRAEERPIDVEGLGAYQGSYTSGTVAAGLGAAATIFALRWADATRTCLIRRVALMAQNAGTAFTAGLTTFDMIVGRSWTVAPSGATALTPFAVTNTSKKRASFGTTLIGANDMRISATGAITNGTVTLDSHPCAVIFGAVQGVATNNVMVPASDGPMTAAAIAATGNYGVRPQDMWFPDISNSWPLVLVQNEGFIIRATVPATGTWRFNIELEWAEVPSTAGYN